MSEELADPHEEPTSAPRYDLGVLLVHGIGVQRRGETLADFGGPILQWLQVWCGGLHDRWVGARVAAADLRALSAGLVAREAAADGDPESIAWAIEAVHELLDDIEQRKKVEQSEPKTVRDLHAAAQALHESVLAAGVELADARRETPDQPQAPAHARLVLRRLRVDGSVAAESWLVAESWWAETFWPPKFADLVGWGLHVVPWTLGSHYGAAVRRVWGTSPASGILGRSRWLGRLTAGVLQLLASLPLALLSLAALALLLLVAAVPIPRLREALGTLQRRIAAIVGDSYILVARPFEAAAMVGQVRRDLGWLADAVGGGELAVLAHSQGAAMAYEALRQAPPRNLRLLLTFGSGLRKLEELRNLLGRGGYLRRPWA